MGGSKSVGADFPLITRGMPAGEVRQLIADEGAVVVKGLLSPEQVAHTLDEVEPYFAGAKVGVSAPPGVDERVARGVTRFFGNNTRRVTNAVTISSTFREDLLDDDWIHEVTTEVLSPFYDDYWLLAAQFIDLGPNSHAQPLHRDMGWFERQGPTGPDTVINFLIALDDFEADNGATRVIPGSHLWPDYEVRGKQEQTVPVEMEAGDALLLGCKIIHGAGANVTADRRRRALGYAYVLGLLTPEEAHPFIVDIDLVRTLSPRAQRMLGFRSLKNYSHYGGAMWLVDYRELAEHLQLDQP